MRLGLQRRIMLYVTAGVGVFSLIFGFVSLQAVQQSTDLVFRERLLAAQLVARAIDADIGRIADELADIGESFAPAFAGSPGKSPDDLLAVVEHWNLFHGPESLASVAVADSQGRVLWSEPNASDLIGHNILEPAQVEYPLQYQRVAALGNLPPSSVPRLPIRLVAPIRRDNQLQGYLIAEIDRSGLAQRLQPLLASGGADYEVELLDGNGVLIAGVARNGAQVDTAHLALVAPLWHAGQPGALTHVIPSVPSATHVIAFAPLSRMLWAVIVEQPAEQALILPHSLQAQFIGFGGLALLAGLVLAWLTTRAVVRPVNALIDASQAIAQGDLGHPLDIAGSDEVGTLSRTFDDMRIKLNHSRAEIAELNHSLEVRVQQRTRELAALVASSHALTSTLDLDQLFAILMEETRAILPAAEAAALFLYERESQRLVVRSSSGLASTYAERLRFQKGEGIAGRTFEDQNPLLLPNPEVVRTYQANLSVSNRLDLMHATGERAVQSALGVPLNAKGTQLGALMLYNLSRASAFSDSDVLVLQALADQAAAAIENARLYKEAGEVGALRELNTLKSEFVVRASHELRTPLTSVKSLAETLLRPELHLDAATQQELLHGINSAADRLSAIVNDLLMLARIESGRLEMQREPIDIPELVDIVVMRFAAQFPAHQFAIGVDHTLPPARGDPERMEDVLYNLLSNAVKYSNAGSRVDILGRHGENGELVIAVADEGIGIPREQWPHLFERFYRVDNAVTRHVGGAGLGLYICKTYVEAMGGRIWVQDNDGRGARFSFTLPPA